MQPTTWILVSNASRGRIFTQTGAKLDLFAAFPHPEGSGTESEAAGGLRFAQSQARFLKHGLDLHEFQELVLVAPYPFLSLLRQALDEGVLGHVVASFPLDLGHLETAPAMERLQELRPIFLQPQAVLIGGSAFPTESRTERAHAALPDMGGASQP